MDEGKYTFEGLYKKYDKFSAPAFEVTVDGKVFDGKKYHINALEVEIAGDGTAGGCSFSVEGHYDYETNKWENGLADVVKPGAKLVVKGGYVIKKELFYGYVDEYSMQFRDEEKPPSLSVSGLDGLGYLMSLREPSYGGKKKGAAVVKEILGKSIGAGFAKKMKVGSIADYEAPIVKEQIDDWKFLNLLAQRYGAALLDIDGELIFDDRASKKTPIITLELGKGLYEFEKRVSLAHQVGKVEIRGRDENQKPIKGEAKSVSAPGEGKSAGDWVGKLKTDGVLREYSEYARTQAECKKMAQNRLDAIAMGFVSGSGRCVGIPELIPGRYIQIAGGDPKSNGTYYLTKVRHLFDGEGYTTAFEVKGAKTK